MRIRSQLILAAFVLAVVPLAAIVTYSYLSSRQALENAYRAEADRLTGQMDRRLAMIRTDLDQRLASVSALPFPASSGGNDVGPIVTMMGEAASLVDALDFEPIREPAPEPEEPEDPNPNPVEEPETEIAEAQIVQAAPPAPPHPPFEPIVIDLPRRPEIPRFVPSEEQRELITEIGKLGALLGKDDLSREEKIDLHAELSAAQNELQKVISADRDRFLTVVREARAQERQVERARRTTVVPRVPVSPKVAATAPVASVPAVAAAPAPATAQAKVKVRSTTPTEMRKAARTAEKVALILGKNFRAPIRKEGEVVGQITARVSPDEVIRRVLGSAAEDSSEVPFAVDRQGTIYTRNPSERARLDSLGVPDRVRKGQSLKGVEGWIVSMSADPQSGLRFGVARPVGDNFIDLRNAAARNFGLGLGLIAFALIGIVPLSNHLTRDVKRVTEGAERIAHGDLMTRLPVKTKNELGQLARAFNRMAEDLSLQQQKLVEGERARKDQEIQQRILEVEYNRKTVELEDARRFQLSLLPKEVPHHEQYEVAVFIRTATEVGGDYYDFHLMENVLSVTIGDATGHGATAGTMVTVIKTLFSAYDGVIGAADFLRGAAEKIKRMDLGRMAMSLALARFDERKLTIASAGMPPVLLHRAAADTVEEIALGATPLGTLGTEYEQVSVALDSGDTVLFLSDGFPELMNDAGQQIGYPGTLDAFAKAARAATAEGVIESLAEAARLWHGDTPPNDDVTFVVVRIA